MDAASIYFGRRLMDMIEEKRAEMTKPLLQGQAIDFPDYKQRAGELKAYAMVLAMMKEITMEDEKKEMRP